MIETQEHHPEAHWWEGALGRWQRHGHHPGDFLVAVLSNDLFEAFGRADEFSKADMDLIVKFIYNQLPGECWGNREKVLEWQRKKS